MNNQECKIRSDIIHVNTNEPMFYPYSTKINKCKGSSNRINDPYAKLCIPDTIKNINVKVFNLMSRTNETRHIEWHKTCKCKCRLDASVCNNKQNKVLHNSCTIYIVLFAVFFIKRICIRNVFNYFQWYFLKNVRIKFYPGFQTTIY